MSCDGTGPTPSTRRTLLGWLLLVPVFVMLAIYGLVAMLLGSSRMDEAYRRTFVTGEFAVYPTSQSWKPGDGLDYRVGAFIDFRQSNMRRWLSRLDWLRIDRPTVTLRDVSGRIYLHLVGEDQPALHRHRLTMDLRCRLSIQRASEIEVSVNGVVVGSADCGEGALKIEADVPPGRMGVTTYDTIEVRLAQASIAEKWLTRFGFLADGVELVSLEVDGG